MFHECSEGAGIHLNPKYYYWELLHPETRQPVAPGEPGVLVFSHVGWRGTVLIRYWTGDLIKGGMRWERCEHCGYTFPRIFPPICRADKDFTKLKGARVDLSLLVDSDSGHAGRASFSNFIGQRIGVGRVFPGCSGGSRRAGTRRPNGHRRSDTPTNEEPVEVGPDQVVFEDNEAEFEKRLFARNGVKADYILERRKHAL